MGKHFEASSNDENVIGFNTLKIRAWDFKDIFAKRPRFSIGDARAYLSTLVDLNIIDHGTDYVAALGDALKHAEGVFRARGYSGVEDDFRVVYKRWLESDRSNLTTGRLPRYNRPDRQKKERTGLTVVSLFTGAYGLDLGFEEAGFDITVALDMSEDSYENLRANRPRLPFIMDDISKYSTQDILREAGLGQGRVDVITGGPPCQPFSTAGKRRGMDDPRSRALTEFIRVVREARPRAFVMEEVRGILSIRDNAGRPLWNTVLEMLEASGYRVSWGVLNAADYGSPQVRERVIAVGIRLDLKTEPRLPSPTHSRKSPSSPWFSLAEALAGITDHIGYTKLPPKYEELMKYVPPGGNWRQLPDDLKRDAMNGAYRSSGGRMGFYRRLTWFEPSPTLVTSPAMKATMMVHPWEDRPLSVREYLRIQGFPDDWKVAVGVREAYRLFGEAVPVDLSRAIAETIRNILLFSISR